jgi:rhamnosyltransferase
MRQAVKSEGSGVPRVSLVIPTLDPGPERLRTLLNVLRAQEGVDLQVIVVDSSSTDGSIEVAAEADIHQVIPRDAFDHGGTRNAAAQLATGDVLAFMTQDALPADQRTIARLIAPIATGEATAAYARQVAPASAPLLERIARDLNYPATSSRRTLADVSTLGIRAFMLSNVASAVDRKAFAALGGFPDRTPFNEDLYLANAVLASGGTIAYVADAIVEHGHTYTLAGLLRRYFDNSASLTDVPEPLRSTPAGASGLRFALAQVKAIVRSGRTDLLPRWVLETGAKWIGFRLGRVHRWLPQTVRTTLSLQRNKRW